MIIRFCESYNISYIFMLSQHLFSGLTWDKIPAQNAKIMIWSKLAHIAVHENKDVWFPMPNSLTRKAEFWQLFHWNSLWWICLSGVFVFSEEGTEVPGWSKYEMSSMSLLRACWLDKPMAKKKLFRVFWIYNWSITIFNQNM